MPATLSPPHSDACTAQSSSTSTATRTCTTCFRTLDIEQFRHRDRAAGTRMHQCARCHRDAERERARRGRRRRIRKFVAAVGRDRDSQRVAALVRQMVEAVGGVDALAEQWSAELRHAMAERPGDAVVLRSFAAMVRMMQFVEERRESEAELLAGLGDEELEQLTGLQIEPLGFGEEGDQASGDEGDVSDYLDSGQPPPK